MTKPPSFESRRARVVMGRAWLTPIMWIGAPGVPLALFGIIGAARIDGSLGALSIWVSTVSLLTALAAITLRYLAPEKREGVLSVAGRKITLDGREVITIDRVAQAVRLAGSDGRRIQLSRSMWSVETAIDIEFASSDAARCFLEAIGRNARQATATFMVARGGMAGARREFRIVYGALAAFVLAEAGVFASVPGLATHPTELRLPAILAACIWITALAVMLGVRASVRRQIVVGVDGIVVRGTRGQGIFHAYREMRDLALVEDDLVVTWTPGQVERLGLKQQSKAFRGAEELAPMAIFDRIVLARRRHLEGQPTNDLSTLLMRGDQDVAAWRTSLECLLATTPTYRTPAVAPEQLWNVLEDPTQSEAMRAGAAVALRVAVDRDGRDRLRVATNSSASVPLRRTLEAAAEEDDDALSTALAGVLQVRPRSM